MHTCRICYDECLPIFYELATINLEHNGYLFVLRRRIGPQNMARIRHMAVGEFNNAFGIEPSIQLPARLETFYIKLKGWTGYGGRSPKSGLSDEQIRADLNYGTRDRLKSSVDRLWNQNPNLKIYLELILGDVPSAQDLAIERPRCYAYLKVELLKDTNGKGWSWGQIDRKGDNLIVDEKNRDRGLDWFSTSADTTICE